jgi:hypothetical protein
MDRISIGEVVVPVGGGPNLVVQNVIVLGEEGGLPEEVKVVVGVVMGGKAWRSRNGKICHPLRDFKKATLH